MKQETTPFEFPLSLKLVFRGIIFLMILLFFFWVLDPSINNYIQFLKSNLPNYGLFGDYVGGFFGTIISGITLVVVFFTFFNQRTELKLTRKQIEKQQFESVFFNMLQMIHTMGKEFKEIKEEDFFVGFMKELQRKYVPTSSTTVGVDLEHNEVILEISKKYNLLFHNKGEKKPTINNLLSNGRHLFNEWRKEKTENEQEYVGLLYLRLFYSYNSQLGNFFRYIHNTIKYSINERTQYRDEGTYINMIQSQLTNYQLSVMFYNCVSPVSLTRNKIPKIKNWLDTYEVFENLPPQILVRPFHQDFYSKTRFKQSHKDYDWSEEDYEVKKPSLGEMIRLLSTGDTSSDIITSF